MSVRRFAALVCCGIGIFVVGALVGRAQNQIPRPDFKIHISNPHGVEVTCVTGCQFIKYRPISGGELLTAVTLTNTLTNLTGSGATLEGVIDRRVGTSGN
jgi:hypothetical protein